MAEPRATSLSVGGDLLLQGHLGPRLSSRAHWVDVCKASQGRGWVALGTKPRPAPHQDQKGQLRLMPPWVEPRRDLGRSLRPGVPTWESGQPQRVPGTVRLVPKRWDPLGQRSS